MFLILIKISGDFPIIAARYRVGPIAAVLANIHWDCVII